MKSTKVHKNTKDLDIGLILNEYKNGLSAAEISKKLGTSHTTILKRLKTYNIKIRPNYNYIKGKRTYSLNEKYFNEEVF